MDLCESAECLQLSVPAPPHDRVIAEYMLIRNDEDLYWRTAHGRASKVCSSHPIALFQEKGAGSAIQRRQGRVPQRRG